jgi:hypothetical protein
MAISLHEKAKLHDIVRAALGKVPDELDLQQLLGRPVLVEVIHRKDSQGRTWANIGSVTRPPQGLEVAPTKTELLFFDLDNPDPAVFQKLPALFRKKIEGRIRPLEPEGMGPEDLDEDIPQ